MYSFFITQHYPTTKVHSAMHKVDCKPKLNPLRAKWPLERGLISRFCSVKRLRVFDSPWTGH